MHIYTYHNHHTEKNRRTKRKKPAARICAALVLCIPLLLTGCASPASLKEKEPLENVSALTVGSSLAVKNIDQSYTLTANNSTLAADGLFYVSWGLGGHEPFENSDGETVELYDANLYLLLGESKTSAAAQENTALWMDAAGTNYDIVNTEDISCNGQDYTLITYNLTGGENPYSRGMSVFATHDTASVCVELTCRDYFADDLKTILTDFLENCSYITEEE